jgi:hypothetical protein
VEIEAEGRRNRMCTFAASRSAVRLPLAVPLPLAGVVSTSLSLPTILRADICLRACVPGRLRERR